MKRLERILVELAAVGAIWLLWDLRLALTAIVILLLVNVLQKESRPRADRNDVPVLREPRE